MTKYIVKDKDYGEPRYWTYDGETDYKDDAYIFTADELKNNVRDRGFLLYKKRYVLIPVKES